MQWAGFNKNCVETHKNGRFFNLPSSLEHGRKKGNAKDRATFIKLCGMKKWALGKILNLRASKPTMYCLNQLLEGTDMALAYSEANSTLSGYSSFNSRNNLCATAV